MSDIINRLWADVEAATWVVTSAHSLLMMSLIKRA